MSNKEKVPSDILVLAIDSFENEFYVSMSKKLHYQDLVLKRPLKITQNFIAKEGMALSELRNSIEKIQINQPNKSFSEFSGKIKMKGNPKAQSLNIDNFVIGGTKITECS